MHASACSVGECITTNISSVACDDDAAANIALEEGITVEVKQTTKIIHSTIDLCLFTSSVAAAEASLLVPWHQTSHIFTRVVSPC